MRILDQVIEWHSCQWEAPETTVHIRLLKFICVLWLPLSIWLGCFIFLIPAAFCLGQSCRAWTEKENKNWNTLSLLTWTLKGLSLLFFLSLRSWRWSRVRDEFLRALVEYTHLKTQKEKCKFLLEGLALLGSGLWKDISSSWLFLKLNCVSNERAHFDHLRGQNFL